MASIAQKKRLERLLRWKQDGVKALSEPAGRNRRLACSRPSYALSGSRVKRVLFQKPGRACGTTHDNTRTH